MANQTNDAKICYTCRSEMIPKDIYVEESDIIGNITIKGCYTDYNVCPKCGCEVISSKILEMLDALTEKRVSELLAKRINYMTDITEQFMSASEVAAKLNIHVNTLLKPAYSYKNLMWNTTIFGKVYFLKESVEEFLRTHRDGRIKLID